MNCIVCNGDQGKIFDATETMFGLGGKFHYWECRGCGMLTLMDPPADMAPYYPSDYYSFNDPIPQGFATRLLDYLRVKNIPVLSYIARTFRPFWNLGCLAPLRSRDNILDVGAGQGRDVFRLRQIGFAAMGVDPFLAADIHDNGSLRVKKAALGEIHGKFAVILLSHSLEHIPDQHGMMEEVRKHLEPGGRAIIRVPLAQDDWREKRSDWRELDAPRHLYLHTPNSFAHIGSPTRNAARAYPIRLSEPKAEPQGDSRTRLVYFRGGLGNIGLGDGVFAITPPLGRTKNARYTARTSRKGS